MFYTNGPLDGQEVRPEVMDEVRLTFPVRVQTRNGFITKVAIYEKRPRKEGFRFVGWENDE